MKSAPVPNRGPVVVPGGFPGRHDRERCIIGGTAAGIGPNAIGPFAG